MKKLILILLALTFVVNPMPLEAHVESYMDSSVPVPINPDKGGQSSGNRSPAQVPISCYYSEGELTFTFSAPLGIVECEVVRVSDNEVFDAMFYAVSGGSDSLYVSTNADDYEITLTCADGTIYYGEYSVE